MLLTPPVKPLFVYISPLLRLKAGLEELLADQDKLGACHKLRVHR